MAGGQNRRKNRRKNRRAGDDGADEETTDNTTNEEGTDETHDETNNAPASEPAVDDEAEKKRQEDEAEAERKKQEEEAERKRQEEEAEAERKRQEEAEEERKRQEEAEAERKRQEEAEAERKRQEEAAAIVPVVTQTTTETTSSSTLTTSQSSNPNVRLTGSTEVVPSLFSRENETHVQASITYKIIIIGNSGVGKTAYLHRFLNNVYAEKQATVNVANYSKTYNIKGKILKYQLWDTAGQERYLSVTRNYFRDAVGVILVYDCTRRDSFEKLEFWLSELKVSDISNDAVLMLVGCKVDQPKAVSTEEAQRFAEKNQMVFFEASSTTGENVHESLSALFLRVYRNAHPEAHESVSINVDPKKEKEKKNCPC